MLEWQHSVTIWVSDNDHMIDKFECCLQLVTGHGPFSHMFQNFFAPLLPSDRSWSVSGVNYTNKTKQFAIVYTPQRIDWSVKMFDELLLKNPHVKQMCEHYQVDIDGCHCALIKDMIRGKRKEPSDDSNDEEAGEKPTRKQPFDEKAFLLEVRIYKFMHLCTYSKC